jgi:murein DD-endopeptidase MepM/ murein hydrolase activator NlpD
MKRPKHSFYLINPFSVSRVRPIRVNWFFIVIITTFFIAGTIGFVRLAWFATSYSRAKLSFYKEHCANEQFMLKIAFLDKFLSTEKNKFNSLVAFEDSARLEYGMEPISADVRKAGIGGPAVLQNYNAEIGNPLIDKALKIQDSLTVLLRMVQLQNATFSAMSDEVERLHKTWKQRPSILPASGNLTSLFGTRLDPVTGETAFHEGFDIANEIGTPVYASADGIVKATGEMQNYGIAVVIDHPENNLETIFAHLSNYKVYPNKHIKRGDLIGFVGNSGKSTGPHLHYEIRENNHPVNPSGYILPANQIVD